MLIRMIDALLGPASRATQIVFDQDARLVILDRWVLSWTATATSNAQFGRWGMSKSSTRPTA